MKRLKLDAFKAKNIDTASTENVNLLLGQVLGDCHDGHNNNDDNKGFWDKVGDAIDGFIRGFEEGGKK